jgi:hypothetical protein
MTKPGSLTANFCHILSHLSGALRPQAMSAIQRRNFQFLMNSILTVIHGIEIKPGGGKIVEIYQA